MLRLGSLDAQFLHVESATTFGHVGSLLLLDPSTAPGGEVTLEAVRDLLEPRLHLAAQLRRRLVEVPLGLGRPYWADDPDFDLEFHVRDIALPPPGSDQQLAEQVARVHARPLDRSRPLWEMYLIHGVDGGRSALYSKIHHAAIDGVTGAEILATVLDRTPEPRQVDPPDELWDPDPLPSMPEMLERGVLDLATSPVELLRTVPRSLPHLADLPGVSNVPGVRTVSEVSGALLRLLGSGSAAGGPDGERRILHPPRTPFNGNITAHRRVSFGSLPLARLKAVKDAAGMSVNDVVMALATTALRRWLLDHDALPPTPLVAAVPVSVRVPAKPAGDDAEPRAGVNQISVMLAALPTHVADPGERLDQVRTEMMQAKRQFATVPAGILQDLSAVVPDALSGLAARALFRLATVPGPPFNLFVSNVPGPQLPLYVAGATVLGIYPVSAVTDMTGGLNLTVFSYNGALDIGLVACREMVPDVWNLLGYLGDALEELLEVTGEA